MLSLIILISLLDNVTSKRGLKADINNPMASFKINIATKIATIGSK